MTVATDRNHKSPDDKACPKCSEKDYNATTKAALRAAMDGKGKSFDSVEALLEDLKQ